MESGAEGRIPAVVSQQVTENIAQAPSISQLHQVTCPCVTFHHRQLWHIPLGFVGKMSALFYYQAQDT